ncbi:MAG: ComEC/Rec2 family competence protein, partial [Gammaproteobacteria bacterium]|nr:ComEC/Rec2 family competence protein [Gammaproteobacteria bacterium]
MRLSVLSFLAGVVLLQSFTILPEAKWFWLLFLCLPMLFFSKLRPLVFIALGMAWAAFRADLLLQQTLPESLEKKDVVIQGHILDIPIERGRVTRFEFQIDSLHYEGSDYPGPGRVRLNWYGAKRSFQAGERWLLTVRLKRPNGFMNPGGFDYESWLFQQGIGATGYVRAGDKRQFLGLSMDPMSRLHRLRQQLMTRIEEMARPGVGKGLLLALSIGERSQIQPQQWDVLRATGTNHLLAISGLHIGLVAVIAFWLGRWLWSLSVSTLMRMPAQLAGALVAACAALAYAALAGFSIPTQRALIMVLAVMLGWLLRHRVEPGDSLSLALLLVLLWDPIAVLAPGFWLSFAAVALIFLVLSKPHAPGLWQRWGRIPWAVFVG